LDIVDQHPMFEALAPGPFTQICVGGIRTARLTKSELAELMIRDVQRARSGELICPRVVTSSNGSVVARYHTDQYFRSLIDQADIVDADGMPIVFVSKLFCKQALQERVATTDFVMDAAAAAVAHNVRFFFLGGKPGVAAEAARNFLSLFPSLQIVGIRDGYFGPGEAAAICHDIKQVGTDVLWLGIGSPRQEAFAIAHKHRLAGVAWIRTCGGLFDHYTSGARRAPLWMQKSGLEWVHRARQEPLRLGVRYLKTNPIALYFLLTRTYG
jgi:N-acetylglucosaminyldiphosphoundecaprenol N-acetyl-beta-D-mannosaminyltransferase